MEHVEDSASLKPAPRFVIEFLGRRVLLMLALGIAIGLCVSAVELCFAYGLQAFLLAIAVANPGAIRLPRWFPNRSLGGILGFLLVVVVLRAALQWSQFYTKSAVFEQFKHDQRRRLLRWAFYSHAINLRRVNHLFTELTNAAAPAVMHAQTALLQATTAFLLAAFAFTIAPRLTSVAAVVVLICLVPIHLINRQLSTLGREAITQWERTNGRLLTAMRNLLLLRIHGMDRHEAREAEATLDAHRTRVFAYYRIGSLFQALPPALGIGLVCVLVLAARPTTTLDPGMLVTYFYVAVRLLQEVGSLSGTVAGIFYSWPSLVELAAWWNETRPCTDDHDERATSAADAPLTITGSIGWEMCDVTFRYEHSNGPVVTNVSLQIAPGSTLVIVGPSGSGKTTLLNLLIGELKPDSGRIVVTFDGGRHELAECTRAIKRHLGYVGPEFFMIEGSIHDNITYGLHESVAREMLDRCIDLAECQFIYNLPNTLDHRLSDQGHGLSAGEKQRLGLLRALLRQPKVLILDEATANLDAATEDRVVATLERLKGTMTTIAVTHRQALLRIADQVVRT
jgi:ABC-type multidrug transport system fused ATPase/permease subunit